MKECLFYLGTWGYQPRVERFLREIKIAANLIHPHILPLYDSGEADAGVSIQPRAGLMASVRNTGVSSRI